MSPLFGFTKYDKDAPGAAVDAATATELRQVANLFLLSGITLVLFIARAFAEALSVDFIPRGVYVVWGLLMLVGWAMTFVYGIYVTFQARRWGWLVACAIPFTCVPAAAAYAWIRRMDIERSVLGEEPPAAARQRRGGRKKR